MKIFSQLKKALLEKFASDPTTELEEGRVIYNTSEKAAKLYNGTTWDAFGSGGGGVGITFIDNGDFEDGTVDGWSTYNDGASAVPVDGAGGVSTNLTLSSESTVQLNGARCFKIAKAGAIAQGEGVARAFTIPKAYRNIKNVISFVYSTDAAYAAGDMAVFLYDVDTSTLITPRISQITGYDKDSPGSVRYRTDFDVASTASVNYRFLFHCTSVNPSAYDLYVDDIEIGPGELGQGPISTEWESFTPTGSMTTNVTYSGQKKQDGDTAKYKMHIDISGVPSGSASRFTFDIPDGTIDTSKLNSTDIYETPLGIGTVTDATGGAVYPVFVVYNDTVSVTLLPINAAGTYAVGALSSATVPITFASGDDIDIEFSVPIAEWAGKTASNLGANDVEYAATNGTWDADDSSTVYGVDGATMGGALTASRDKTVTFQTPLQKDDQLVVQLKPTSTSAWIDASEFGVVAVRQSTSFYGVVILSGVIGSTTAVVRFYQYAQPSGATYGGAGSSWNSSFSWRIVKHRSGIPVWFGNATSEHSGLVKMDSDATTNVVGEYETYSSSGTTTGAVGLTVGYTATRIGNTVMLDYSTNASLNTATSTSSASIALALTLPASMLPSNNIETTVKVRNSGAVQGQVVMATANTLTWTVGYGAAFSNAVTAGIYRTGIIWTV